MPSVKKVITLLPDFPRKNFLRRHYLRKFRAARLSDEKDLQVIPQLVSPSDTVLDIGANFGLYTRFLSDAVGESGRVYSFEPTSDMFDALKHNVESLGRSNITCVRAALSDWSGKAEIHIPPYPDGTPNYYEATLLAGDDEARAKGESVAILTVDEFCQSRKIKPLSFMKCDVEGFEIEVLRGAQNVIQCDHPVILLEINEPLLDGAHGTEVTRFIKEMGYEIHVYENDDIHPWKLGYFGVNYILFPALHSSY